MLNHLRRPRQTVWGVDVRAPAGGAFTLRSLPGVSLPQGARVHDSYGRKCNSRFLLHYGFALHPNCEPAVGGRRQTVVAAGVGSHQQTVLSAFEADAQLQRASAPSTDCSSQRRLHPTDAKELNLLGIPADPGGEDKCMRLMDTLNDPGEDANELRLLGRLSPEDPWFHAKLRALGPGASPVRELRVGMRAGDSAAACVALSFLRLAAARGEDVARLPILTQVPLLVQPLSLANERAALALLADAAGTQLRSYARGRGEDLAELAELRLACCGEDAAERTADIEARQVESGEKHAAILLSRRRTRPDAAQRASALALLVGEKAVAQFWAEAPAALSRMLCPGASLTEAEQVLQEMAKAARMAAEEALCLTDAPPPSLLVGLQETVHTKVQSEHARFTALCLYERVRYARAVLLPLIQRQHKREEEVAVLRG